MQFKPSISSFSPWRKAATRYFLSCLVGAICWLPLAARAQEESYPVPPEVEQQEGVPTGKVEGPFDLTSELYPGTTRQYWVYVPAQYDAAKPACTMIVQDGLNRAKDWRIPQICDTLIHSQEMPITIGIFVTPGIVPASRENAQPRFNRSFEYDSLGDRYARFLLEELIPAVSKSYNLSTDPNDRMLAGASSGAICAFNAAWERPDAFRRVYSTIGTYVGLRGANEFPVLIRKLEPKPIRVFLQDGSHDLNIYAGDWWLSNQQMLSALTWAGYDVEHAWGEGGHNGKHSASITPQALRWLWRNYPDPVTVPKQVGTHRRIDVLVANSGWEQVTSGHESAASPTCNAEGELFFCDSTVGRIYRIGEDGKTRIFADQTGKLGALSFGPDGKLYATKDQKQIVRFDMDGKQSVLLADNPCQTLVALPEGVYFTDAVTPAIWFCSYSGSVQKALPLVEPVSAMAPTTDHAFMHLLSSQQQYTTHARIGTDGSLSHRQRYGYLHMPYMERDSGARAIAVDVESRALVATTLGIQVLDQLGRVNLILNRPSLDPINGMAFGGTARSTLYVAAGGSVYKRVLNTRGEGTSAQPVEPPKPGL
ncbi:alpha/beta hydrolase-fold protein [Aureliella helgolandensis]|uniref:Carbohydrate acetyl esterase/feruloyl esterase n=1 Tax=Aureliella helgolandensis TaxID=2527968 RepID=A0A518G6W9_9BACT|nr:alpha/beta hydrolase-fold protein [Aureliella helgolandensis]QDV24321.1 Carbohydrate acetyl esterase/feruloyl esterase precursor [Aureliella helgolandensis]